MFGWLLLTAMASGAEIAAYSPAIDAVSRGDLALAQGERAEARAHFLEAVHLADPAAEAMARLRLLGLSGNLGAVVHGPKLDDALARCEGDWCAIAKSDYHRIVPVPLGASRSEAIRLARLLVDVLPGPALARLYVLTEDPAHLESLQQQVQLDGLGTGLVMSQGGRPPNPGTWFLGMGLTGSAGVGVAGNAVFFHPDLFWKEWWMKSGVWFSSRGSFGGTLAVEGPSSVAPRLSIAGSDAFVDFYEGETRTSLRVRRGNLALGPVYRAGAWKFGVPALLTLGDSGEGWQRSAGVGLEVTVDHRRGRGNQLRGVLVSLESRRVWGDVDDLFVFADSRGFVPFGAGVLAGRMTFQGAFVEGIPDWLLPVVGGSELHRGAWHARWRAPRIGTVDLEQRWRLTPSIGAVVFSNTAWVQGTGFHPGAGIGVRLVLPPEDWNIVRMDLGFSDTGWSVTAGWGEAF
ncbi:MAG: hypothetical protein VX519_05725 [Myxococcota bacterium]|nr:hypothetical protein [Myxococcota bacterium]